MGHDYLTGQRIARGVDKKNIEFEQRYMLLETCDYLHSLPSKWRSAAVFIVLTLLHS